jgi:hypothetical protein
MIKNYISMTTLSLLFAVSLLFAGSLSHAQVRKTGSVSGHAFLWSDIETTGYKKEVTEKRSRYTKHFELNDGSMKMYSSPGSMHYQTGNTWEEINLGIHTNTSGVHSSHPYFNGDNSFKTWYPQSPMSGKLYTSVKDGDMSEQIESMYATDQNGNTVYTYQTNTPQVTVSDNMISYSNLFPNTIVRYAQQVDGRKLDVELQSNQALSNLPTNAKFLVIKEKVTIPANWTVTETAGYINLFSGNTWVANFLKPTAFETQSPDKAYTSDEDFMNEGEISMTRSGNVLTLYTKFSLNWLKASNRQFPVRLDPTTNFYPPTSASPTASLATGRLTSATSGKSAGFLRMAAAGSFAWAKFDITTLAPGAAISSATYFGYNYSPTGTQTDKIVTVVGMQSVDPETATNGASPTVPQISNQINLNGPIYSSNYVFGGTNPAAAPFTWRSAPLTGNATGDIASQQTQGWTALGFKYTSGSTTTMLQNGEEIQITDPSHLPYLTLVYTTGACSGTPTAGAAISSVLLACGDPFSLNLSGNSTGVGTTYQWQSSPAGLNTWTNLGIAQSSSNYTTTQSTPYDYRCVVTCTGSGLSSTSTIVAVGQNTVANCYCIPSGPASSTNYINSVTTSGAIVNISNTGTTYSTSPSAGYGNYTSLIMSANPSTAVNIQVTFVAGSQTVGVWADWNRDGDFNDAGETLIQTSSAAASPYNNTFTIPATAIAGTTRLRIRTTTVGTAQVCGFDANGETEDYTINVLGPCTSAPLATIATSSYVICPLTTQVLTATVPTVQLGTTYQWQQSTTPGGPYSNVVGGTGATTLSYTTPALAAGTYYYVLQTTCANCGPCSQLSNQATIVAQNVNAPVATNSAQCAPGVPTAFVTSAAGAIGTGNFNWYNAPTAGTLLQSKPYGPVVPYYFNDFSSIFLSNSSITGNSSITTGVLQMHSNTVSQYGGFMVNASNFNSDKYTVDFDYTTTGTPATMGEGFSYSFADDAVITAEASMNAENGTGSKLKVCFVAYTNGASSQGIYLIYGNSTFNEPTPTTPGVLGYSSNVSWKNASGHVKISLDSLGRASMILNGVTLFNNVQLPAAFNTANKASWKHVWKGRTTTNTMFTSFDNIDIKQSTLSTGSPTYLSNVAATTTFYVSELGTNGCLSPRTPITVTVNTPPTLAINAIPSSTVCTGAPITLSGSGAISYVWNGNATTVNGDTTFSSAVAGTFTVTGTDANNCSNTSTVTVSLLSVLNGTATATPNLFCFGGSANLTATATPICTGLASANFVGYYAPTAWTFENVLANGTLITTGAPANIKLTTGTDGSFNYGTTGLSRKITCSGTVSFNWSFMHPAEAYVDFPQYAINGGTPIDFPTYSTGGYNGTQTGTISFPVAAGDSITIYAVTLDNDATAGMLTVSNFSAPSPLVTGSISYWDAATGGTNLGTPPLTVTPATSGIVTYYAAYTSNTTGCVNQVREPVNVTVHPIATATLSGGGTVCAGSPLPNISIDLTGSAPWNLTYTYDGTPVTVTGITTSPYVITNAAVGTYVATAASDAFCTGTASGTAGVALYTLPTATVTGGGMICAGSPLPDVAIALTGNGPWSMTYTDGTTSTTVNAIASSPYIISGAAAGTYAVTNVSDINCTGTSSGTASVIVNMLPVATLSGGGTVCTGSPLPNISIDLTGASPWYLTYTLDGIPVTVTGINASPYVITNPAVGTYMAVSVGDAFCTGSASGTGSVALYTLPTATVSGGGTLCAGNALPDVSIALTGSGPWSFTYTDGTTPTTMNGFTGTSYTITAAAAGSYAVTNVSDINCVGTSSGIANVVVNSLPVVTATITPSTICYASSATANGGGAVSYVWNNGVSDNTAFVGTSTTTYIVTGTDANNCTATSSATLTVNTVGSNLAQATSGNTASITGVQSNTNVQPDGSSIMYSDASCNLIATVQDLVGGNTLGNTTTAVNVDPTVLTYPAIGGQPYSRRWYAITPTNNVGVNADVTMYQTQADFDDYNLANGIYPDLPIGPADAAGIANIRITKVSGGGLGVGTASVIAPSSVVWNALTNYWEITFNVSGSFSEFYVHAANPFNSALPVSISSFTGVQYGESDILKWTSSSEQNNAYFNLQHSTDGIRFVTLQKVLTQAVGGNSAAGLYYQTTNSKPSTGHNYYRLQQVDIDGKSTLYANVIDLNRLGKGSSVNIYPNPVNDVLNIDLMATEASVTVVKITDMSGRLIQQVQTNAVQGFNTIQVNLSALSSGLYTIQLLENGQSLFIERIRKD